MALQLGARARGQPSTKVVGAAEGDSYFRYSTRSGEGSYWETLLKYTVVHRRARLAVVSTCVGTCALKVHRTSVGTCACVRVTEYSIAMDSYLLATVDVRVVGDEVGGAADEQVQADDVAEEEEARVPG